MSFLTISKISKQVDKDLVLKGVSFTQEKFQKIVVAGETGSGKSTLLKIVAGLVQPDEGEVLFEQQRVPGPEEKLIPGHPGIAYLSQHFELLNNYKVEEVLLMSNTMPGKEAETIYEVCRINHLLKRRTDQLSGGEKQRIATAKLLISSPKLLLLDEPYSNVDIIHKNILKTVINDISERLKITCMMTLHEPLDTLSWADEIIVMRAGQILQKGTPQQIYRQPTDEYTAALTGSYNLIHPTLAEAFNHFNPVDTDGKKLLVRPEEFCLSGEERPGVKGTVNKVTFFGSHYEIEVLILKDIITVKTEQGNFVKGDEVYVSLATGSAWFV